MVLDDGFELGQELPERHAIVGRPEVAFDRVKEPERRVGRVIQPFLRALRKHVRDEAIPDVMPEGAEDVAGLPLAARAQGQPLEADHRVAAPVGEPMITSDDRTDLVAGRPRARSFLAAARRRDDELVGREHHLRRNAAVRHPLRRVQQTFAALVIGFARLVGFERADRLPRFRRRHERPWCFG